MHNRSRKGQPRRSVVMDGNYYNQAGVIIKSCPNSSKIIVHHIVGKTKPNLDEQRRRAIFESCRVQENLKMTSIDTHMHISRCCASCGTVKTCYWRESWDPYQYLCNPCGLRYAKFRKKCAQCRYIPKTLERTADCCPRCNGKWSL